MAHEGNTVTITRYDGRGEAFSFSVRRAPHGRVWCPTCGSPTKIGRLELRWGLLEGLVCRDNCGALRLPECDSSPLGSVDSCQLG